MICEALKIRYEETHINQQFYSYKIRSLKANVSIYKRYNNIEEADGHSYADIDLDKERADFWKQVKEFGEKLEHYDRINSLYISGKLPEIIKKAIDQE